MENCDDADDCDATILLEDLSIQGKYGIYTLTRSFFPMVRN